MKKTRKKPFVIIRKHGYYINSIENSADAISAWRKDNVIRTDFNAAPNRDGTFPKRKMDLAIRDQRLSFAPATAREVAQAPAFSRGYEFRYGLPGEYANTKSSGSTGKTAQRS